MNYKYILFSLFLFPFNINSMSQEPATFDINYATGEPKKLNLLPEKLRKIIVNNSFCETGQSSTTLEEVLGYMDWANWSKEEIKIICDILNIEKARSHTQMILSYLYNLQCLCSAVNYDLQSSRLHLLILFNNLIRSLISSDN